MSRLDWIEVKQPETPRPEPVSALTALRAVNALRRKHRARSARAQALYLAAQREALAAIIARKPAEECERANQMVGVFHLELMRAQEASRGSRIAARRAHEAWGDERRSVPSSVAVGTWRGSFERIVLGPAVAVTVEPVGDGTWRMTRAGGE